jgi:hypothetical protein
LTRDIAILRYDLLVLGILCFGCDGEVKAAWFWVVDAVRECGERAEGAGGDDGAECRVRMGWTG